jgi:pyruvate dehydrogenase E1 component beta subunit
MIVGSPLLSLDRRTSRLVEEFGPERIWSKVPIAETGYVGAAIGAALVGLRPIVSIGTGSFVFNAWPQVVNEMPQFAYMTGGQVCCPLVLHLNAGARGAGAPQHSHSPEAMLMNTPGLKIIIPSTPRDVKGLLRSAVADDNPVVFVDHTLLHDLSGPVPDEPEMIPLGLGDVKREGRDVTLVAAGLMVQRALFAAAQLDARGISVEVVDLRSLAPLDIDLVLSSLAKTGRLVVADETQRACGVGAEVCAQVLERGLDLLRAPAVRVAVPNVPIPFSPVLEDLVVPQVETIVEACRRIAP